jgi:peptide subunit release factor RF-3
LEDSRAPLRECAPQFDEGGGINDQVVQYRLQTESGAESRLEAGRANCCGGSLLASLMKRCRPSGARLATDVAGRTVILFLEEWACNAFIERNPGVTVERRILAAL